jgi:hypothetical protein
MQIAFIPHTQLRHFASFQWPAVRKSLIEASGAEDAELRIARFQGMECISPHHIVLTNPKVDAQYIEVQWSNQFASNPVWVI